jgi:hypothetical protein
MARGVTSVGSAVRVGRAPPGGRDPCPNASGWRDLYRRRSPPGGSYQSSGQATVNSCARGKRSVRLDTPLTRGRLQAVRDRCGCPRVALRSHSPVSGLRLPSSGSRRSTGKAIAARGSRTVYALKMFPPLTMYQAVREAGFWQLAYRLPGCAHERTTSTCYRPSACTPHPRGRSGEAPSAADRPRGIGSECKGERRSVYARERRAG